MMKTCVAAIGAVAAVLAFGTPAEAAGVTVQDKGLNITFSLPEGFERMSDVPASAGEDLRFAFRRPGPAGETDALVVVRTRRGMARQGHPATPNAREEDYIKTYRASWKSFDLNVVVVRESMGGVAFQTHAVLVPTKPRAIVLKVTGPESKDAELAGLMHDLVGTLDGETNWITEQGRNKLMEEAGYEVWGRLVLIWVATYFLVKWREKVFRRQAQAMGLPPEVAAGHIRPGFIWYLPVGLLFCAGPIVVLAIGLYCDNTGDLRMTLLEIHGGAILAAIAWLLAVMWARRRAKRRIIATLAPPPPSDVIDLNEI